MSPRAMAGRWILLVGLLGALAPLTRAAPDDDLSGRMQGMYLALTALLPRSLSEAAFSAPENHQGLAEALDVLVSTSRQIAGHGTPARPGFDHLGAALAEDANRALQDFEKGDLAATQRRVLRLTEYCFACHSRLPAHGDNPLGAGLLEDARVQSLPIKDRMLLAVVSRRFDTALELGETLFESKDVPPGEADQTGALGAYLKIALRVEGSPRRARATLERLRGRPDTPPYLAAYLDAWIETLEQVGKRAPQAQGFDDARRLVAEGQSLNRYPADRMGLIHFVVASGILHRYVESAPEDTERLAEACYLLGIAEANLTRGPWPPETEQFLETAVRLAPASSSARSAYLLLEEIVTANYTGSEGTNLPPAVAAKLKELRSLLGPQ